MRHRHRRSVWIPLARSCSVSRPLGVMRVSARIGVVVSCKARSIPGPPYRIQRTVRLSPTHSLVLSRSRLFECHSSDSERNGGVWGRRGWVDPSTTWSHRTGHRGASRQEDGNDWDLVLAHPYMSGLPQFEYARESTVCRRDCSWGVALIVALLRYRLRDG